MKGVTANKKVQDHRTAQGRSRRGRDSTHRRPCGTSPNPATLCDRSAQGSKSWHSGSFAKYSDIGLVTISFPAYCVSHRATGLPVMVHDMHTRRRIKTGLPTGMSHRTACGWSQVCIDSGPVALCGPVGLPFAVTRPRSRYYERQITRKLQDLQFQKRGHTCIIMTLYHLGLCDRCSAVFLDAHKKTTADHLKTRLRRYERRRSPKSKLHNKNTFFGTPVYVGLRAITKILSKTASSHKNFTEIGQLSAAELWPKDDFWNDGICHLEFLKLSYLVT